MTALTAIPVRTTKAHVALNVANVEKSIAFYRTLFGIEPMKVRSDYAKFDVENPPLNLTLNQTGGGSSPALSHLGIQVASTDDVLSVRDLWKEAGLEPRDEMGTSCCYALQDKAWVEDPDGNEWEVFTVLADNLTESTICCGVGADASATTTAKASASEVKNTEAEAACCEPGSGCC